VLITITKFWLKEHQFSEIPGSSWLHKSRDIAVIGISRDIAITCFLIFFSHVILAYLLRSLFVINKSDFVRNLTSLNLGYIKGYIKSWFKLRVPLTLLEI
jgi:hypothetical protein